MKRWDLRKSRRARRLGAPCVPAHHGLKVPLRAAGGQEGKHLRFSPSCQSSPFPSGRAARVKVSDAFHLPPNCYCDRQGIGCHPRGVRGASRARTAPGRSVAFTRTVTANLASPALPPPGSGAKLFRRDVIANQIFPQYVDKICLRSRAPVTVPWRGVIDKRGQGPLLPARRPRRPHSSP